MWLYYLISVDWAYKPRNEVSDDAILPNPPNAIMCLRKEHKKSFQYMVKSLHFIFQIWVKGENCRHNVKKEVGNRASPDHVQVNWRQIFNNSLSVNNWIKWIIDYCGKSLYKLFLAWFHFEPQMTWTWSGIRYTTHQSKANAIKLTFSLKSGTLRWSYIIQFCLCLFTF